MAAPRLLMRRLRNILRLKYDAGLTHRAIAQACAVGLGTVSSVLARATAAGLPWPLPDGLDDGTLLLLWREYRATHPTGQATLTQPRQPFRRATDREEDECSSACCQVQLNGSLVVSYTTPSS